MWVITLECTGLLWSQDRSEVPYIHTNIDLDHYLWDIEFELEDSYKSTAHDANKSRNKDYGYHTFYGNYWISSEKNRLSFEK